MRISVLANSICFNEKYCRKYFVENWLVFLTWSLYIVVYWVCDIQKKKKKLLGLESFNYIYIYIKKKVEYSLYLMLFCIAHATIEHVSKIGYASKLCLVQNDTRHKFHPKRVFLLHFPSYQISKNAFLRWKKWWVSTIKNLNLYQIIKIEYLKYNFQLFKIILYILFL